MADPALLDVFERFVAIEVELAGLLQASADRDRTLLRAATGIRER